jgi:hypothetical protein
MDDLEQGPADVAEEPHFLDDPDVSTAFATMLQEFAGESDRGAVLIAADVVAAHLGVVIRELAPAEFGAKRLKAMLSYPGLVSGLAARADVALMAAFIDPTVHRAITTLRRLRNNAAHSQAGFRLKDNLDLLRKISDLGPGVTPRVNQSAIEAVVTPYFDSLLNKGLEMERQTGRNLLPDKATILSKLREHPDTMEALEERALRTELAFAVWLLLGSMAHKRKSLVASRAAPN